MFNKQEWLDSLKEGDRVIVKSSGISNTIYRTYTIDRITPTRIFKVGLFQFNSQGEEKGRGSYSHTYNYLEPYTQEAADAIEKSVLVKQISNTKFSEMSLKTLREINKLLTEESE